MGKKISSVIGLIVIIVSLICLGTFKLQQIQYNKETANVKQMLNQRKKVLKERQKIARRSVLNENLVSSNKAKSENTQDYEAKHDLQIITKNFFNEYFTYDSHNTYIKRKDKVRRIATSSVLNDKKLFNNGLDKTGHSITEAEHLASVYDGSNAYVSGIDQNQIVSGIVEVSYSSRKGSHSSSKTTDIYLVKFDSNQRKLIQIQRIGTIGTVVN
ncbi:hypothetical protein [Limosilactobacillus reuteri]|uniref:hypothetical protein n=1 Tax=Limosilactobacillus reuteri TaxID=1598 RepID=UPI000DE810E9|nr:hypothetical protein [Limosilactobacillus reuteri]MRN06223.1 hypothetical protein [Lactobacillus sp. 0.1XD8-4]AXX75085.1 hypothetical protein DL317_10570 [Limosilactobacillus reuteri]MCC4359256.1 hypothetical protein [Limosilactobacillus reuteri]MCC4362380.1 hypothetical protein [Limosilactobacillus reuteri]MCC4365686.1 hypothetical protein [Limosilactobacillus reuteri]